MGTSKKTLSILHIDTGADWRGGQRQVLTLHSLLLKNGVDSSLICNVNGKLYAMAKDNKVPQIIGVDYRNQLSIKCHKEVHKIYASIKPEIIHCHDSPSVSLVRFIKGSIKFHTRRVSYPINNFSILFKYSSIDFHIGVSNEIRDYLARFFKNTFAIHSCVDKTRFKKIGTKPAFDSKGINILFVGAFTSQKGIEILIPAFKDLVKKYSDIHLHMVGDGELRSWSDKKVKEIGITDNVIFYGSRNDIEKFYIGSDIVVCPSVSGEGSSGVIKEAMAAGKTVIASDLVCNKEIIEDGVNGILFKNQDMSSLFNAFESVLSKKIVIDHRAINQKVKKFSCNNMAIGYINLYKLAINE